MTLIRPLTPEDAEAFVALRRAMLIECPWAFASSPECDRGCDVELTRASLSRAGSMIVAAFENAEIVASTGLVREERPKRRHIATIWGVYVAPAARGRGMGRRIVDTAIHAARGWPGVECLQLAVSANAPIARKLYESLGFAAWGVEPDALRVDGVSHAETHMRLIL